MYAGEEECGRRAGEGVSPKDGSRSLAPGDGFFLRFGNV